MADKVVLSYHDSLLRESDVSLLQPRGWLNDNIIGFMYEYFENNCFSSDDVLFIQPSMVQLIKLCSTDDLTCFLGDWELVYKRLIVLPINNEDSMFSSGGTHWSLLVLHCKDLSFYHIDSIKGVNIACASKLLERLQPHLGLLLSNGLQELNCPQQYNGCDCGVFVIHFTKQVCEARDRPTFKDLRLTVPPTEYRNQMKDLISSLQCQ